MFLGAKPTVSSRAGPVVGSDSGFQGARQTVLTGLSSEGPKWSLWLLAEFLRMNKPPNITGYVCGQLDPALSQAVFLCNNMK